MDVDADNQLDERTGFTDGRAGGVDVTGIPVAPFYIAWRGAFQGMASATPSSSRRADADAGGVQPDAITRTGRSAHIVAR